MERLIQFNLTRESLPLEFQWPVNSYRPSPSTTPEIEMKVMTVAPTDSVELSPCEQEDRERMFQVR